MSCQKFLGDIWRKSRGNFKIIGESLEGFFAFTKSHIKSINKFELATPTAWRLSVVGHRNKYLKYIQYLFQLQFCQKDTFWTPKTLYLPSPKDLHFNIYFTRVLDSELLLVQCLNFPLRNKQGFPLHKSRPARAVHSLLFNFDLCSYLVLKQPSVFSASFCSPRVLAALMCYILSDIRETLKGRLKITQHWDDLCGIISVCKWGRLWGRQVTSSGCGSRLVAFAKKLQVGLVFGLDYSEAGALKSRHLVRARCSNFKPRLWAAA